MILAIPFPLVEDYGDGAFHAEKFELLSEF
jgi:hypothetical protein